MQIPESSFDQLVCPSNLPFLSSLLSALCSYVFWFCSLVDPVHLEQLVKYVAVPPEADSSEVRKMKYPVTSSEILCAEIRKITDALFAKKDLLDLICHFLDGEQTFITREQAIVTILCSKVICFLLVTNLEDMLDYFRSTPYFFEKLMNHIANPRVVEIILKLIKLDGPSMQSNGPVKVGFCVPHFFFAF